jgi:hypothetical protein
MQWQRGSTRGCASGVLTIIAACSIQLAVAGPDESWPATPALDGARVIPEHELAKQRGRFVQGGRVVRFGLRMASQLQSASGEMLRGGVNLHVDMSSSRPQVKFTPTMSIESGSGSISTGGDSAAGARHALDRGGSRNRGDGGSANGNGIVQRVQVAGEANSAVNDMRIDVVEHMDGPASHGGSRNTDVAIHGTNGSRVEISAGERGMELALDLPGSGRVSQRVVSGRGVEQLIQLSGQLNRASSIARLRVELRDTLSGDTASMRRALDSIEGLR